MYQPKVKQTQKHSDSQGEHIVHKGKLLLVERDSESNSLLTQSSIGYISKREGDIIYDPKGLDPIIISETEEIVRGDIITNGKDLFKWSENRNAFLKVYPKWIPEHHRTYVNIDYEDLQTFNKTLALPENFSEKHLQAIVDGKMNDGDEVLIKCIPDGNGSDYQIFVYLNQQNHITLFPVKQPSKNITISNVIELVENEIHEWKINGKGTPSCQHIVEMLKDYNKTISAKQSLEDASDSFVKKVSCFSDEDAEHFDPLLKKSFIAGAKWAKKNNY